MTFMEDDMTEHEVTNRAAQLLHDVERALSRGDLAEAIEYLTAARALIEGTEAAHKKTPRSSLTGRPSLGR